MSTALDLITEAMREVGAIFLDEAPTDSEAQVGLRRLNWMLDTPNSLIVRATIQGHYPLVSAQYAYTIGTGGDFNAAKPIKIVGAFVRDSVNLDYPVAVITRDEYDSLEDKAFTTGRPDRLYYDPGATQQASQLGTVNVYPIPDASGPYELYIDQNTTLTEFATLTDNVTFESTYWEYLLYGLAERLWGIYHNDGKPVKPDLLRNARRSRKAVETMNSKQLIMRTDLPGAGAGAYNINTQGYS